MKVFFDCRMITHPGIGRYIKCLLPQLARSNEVELCLLGNSAKIKAELGGIRGEIIDFDYPIYSLQEQFGFFKLRKAVDNNILHVPHYNVPLKGNFKLVATIHDLIHILYPRGASNLLAPLYMRSMLRKCAQRAKRIICVSYETKRLLRATLSPELPAEVIYEGVDNRFGANNDPAFLEQLSKKYSLPKNFILYVGSIRKHKNISGLLQVFSELRKKRKDIFLVIVGRLSQKLEVKGEGVIFLGEVMDDLELAGIYNLAYVFCNLSLHEGFGLTIVEAQASLLPVICSKIPVHLEIGGAGIAAVDPTDVEQAMATIEKILDNHTLRQELVHKGLENVKRFSWEKTAQETLKVYKGIE